MNTRDRLFFADWLRIAAFALLVLYHVGMYYVPWGWHIKSGQTFGTLEPLMRLSNPWRMSLLFVVSGLATGIMLGRPGLARERSRRLLLPLAFGMAVLVPPQSYLEVVGKLGYEGAYLDFLRLYFRAWRGFTIDGHVLVLPTWNHLWFLPYLWCYTMMLLLARRFVPAPWCARAAAAVGSLDRWHLLLWPVAFLAMVRVALLGRFGETHALVDDWFNHATYLPLFLFGVAAARDRQLFARFEAQRWLALAVALAAWSLLVAYFEFAGGAPAVPDGLRLVQRVVHAAMQWSAVVAAFGFAHRHLNFDHRWRAPLTEAVFPVYLVHQTLIMLAAAALRSLALQAGVEASVLVGFTFAAALLLWRLTRRLSWLRPWMGMSASGAGRAGDRASVRLTTQSWS